MKDQLTKYSQSLVFGKLKIYFLFLAILAGFVGVFAGEPAIAKKKPVRDTKNLSKSSKSSKTSKTVSAWKLKQSSNLVGPIQCVVSRGGVRLNAEKLGLLWIFQAPDWDAYLYNQETKNFCSFKYDEWTKRGFFVSGSTKHKGKPIGSLKQIEVKRSGKKMDIANLSSEQVELFYKNGIKYGEFWVSSKVVVPKQFKLVVANMLHLPMQDGGTPLKAILRNKHGKLVPVLQTESAEEIKVDSSIFKPLKGYGRVKDEMALLFTGSDMFGSDSDSMFGAGAGGNKGKK